MTNPLNQDYESYLGLSKNTNFVGGDDKLFNKAFVSITNTYVDNNNALFLIYSMCAFSYENNVTIENQTPISIKYQSVSVFYNFWNNPDNIEESRVLIQ
jgi:hypothetical protein